MKLSIATNKDFQDIESMLLQMHSESLYKEISASIEKIREVIRVFVEEPDKCCFLVRSQGRIAGLFMGYTGEFFFSREYGAWDLVFYVSPKDRGSRAAYVLFGAYRRWALDRGAKMVWLMSSTGINRDRTARVYERLGLEKVGDIFRNQ